MAKVKELLDEREAEISEELEEENEFGQLSAEFEEDPNSIPDAYDNYGNLTVNSWALFRDEELAREEDEEDA